MEKYSKATQDFIKSFEEEPTEEKLKDIVRAGRLASRPEKIPRAILAYGLSKTAMTIPEDINPVELKDLLVDAFGVDWIMWAPETIRKTILDGKTNEVVENKIQAIAVCLRSDDPWIEWHIFENVGKAFNHQVPNFGILQPLSVGECAVTMYNMNKLRSDEDFSQEVLIYIAARAADENYVYLPEELEVSQAQEHLDSFTYDPWLKEAVKDRWEKIRNSDKLTQVSIKEEPVEVQLGKLIVMKQYFKENTEE